MVACEFFHEPYVIGILCLLQYQGQLSSKKKLGRLKLIFLDINFGLASKLI